ncbi:MAG: FAD-binding oxidoreductase [Vicinamibacterales bacterium]|nr:FAD-binding oxidoreductase [Vicinamibacterales bacterium]
MAVESAEVCIIGGGCMGASTAYHLARLGIRDIVVIEREAQLATGSTGRNAGGVRHQFSDPANIALSIESIALLERFEAETGTPIDFWQDGYLFLLSSEASEAAFRANVSLQRTAGVEVEWLDAGEAARRVPGLVVDGVRAATFCARDGIADPNGVTMGFAKAAQAAGVRVMRDTEVTGIDIEGGRVTGVVTSRGRISTPMIVNAAGPWARQIGAMAGVTVPIDPLRRHIFIAQPEKGASWDAPVHRGKVPESRLMVIDFETSFYFHREGAGLLFGMGDPAEASGFDTTVRWDFLPQVTEVAMTRLPALGDAAITHAWAGLYEMTPDHNPIIGPAGDVAGVFTIAGFSGHGFMHAPAAGRALADVIAGRDPKLNLSPFAHARFAAGRAGGEQNVV